MDHSLLPLLLTLISIMLVALSISLILWVREGSNLYGYAVFMWVCQIISYLSQGLTQDNLFISLAFSIQFPTALFFARIVAEPAGHRIRVIWFLPIWFGAIALSATIHYLGASFLFVSLPITIGVAVPGAFAGLLALLRPKRALTFSGTAMAVLALLAVAHAMTYPILRKVEWFAPYGFAIGCVAAFALAIFSTSSILEFELTKKNAEIRNYATNLEGMVEDRSRRLEESLETVSRLRTKQDTDYYRISRLTRPLNECSMNAGRVRIDSVLRQKKTFTFEKKKRELGGDVIICSRLRLSGEETAVFINADAMGKSLGGAGGAIALSSAFRALLERYRENPIAAAVSPGDWLHTIYGHLQQLFLSFNEAMTASAVIGALVESSGELFFLNAAHPDVALLRGGKARFIESGHEPVPPLGAKHKHPPSLNRIRLRKGDQIFIGSDGKDDVRLLDGVTPDETVFLRILEESSGSLDSVFGKLSARGKIIDDFSIMRVHYD